MPATFLTRIADFVQQSRAPALALALVLLAAAPAAAQDAVPARPETPEAVEACLTDLACSASWLLGRIDAPKVRSRPQQGALLAASWKSWSLALTRAGRKFTGPPEAPPELVEAGDAAILDDLFGKMQSKLTGGPDKPSEQVARQSLTASMSTLRTSIQSAQASKEMPQGCRRASHGARRDSGGRP